MRNFTTKEIFCVDCGDETKTANLHQDTPLCAKCYVKLHARAISSRKARKAKILAELEKAAD